MRYPAPLAAVIVVTAAATAQPRDFTYLALGDSLAWGYRSINEVLPGPGDQGYVSGVADGLADRNGGIRPTVLNFGVPGDTSANFFAGGEFGAIFNTNFPRVFPTGPQNALMQAALAQNPFLPGGPIEFVTLQLGVNDLIDLVDIPGFLDLPLSTQLNRARAEFARIEANLSTILVDLTTALPDADIRIIGYYDPFAVFLDHPELDPFFTTDGRGADIARLSDPIIPELNGLLAGLASRFDLTYVETADIFAGRELELTSIATIDLSLPNIHPNELGYALLAERILAVPAPASLALGIACAPLLARRRRA